ncbi:Protease [Minicystis rosea]|nr:Protease [Minicystis rosea]
MKARFVTVPTLGLSLLAAAVLHGHVARADQGPTQQQADPLREPVAVSDGTLFPTGDLDPTAWDIPGELIVDLKDDVEESAVTGLLRGLGLTFHPTSLSAITKAEIVDVPLGRMTETIEKLRRDPRVEIVEPLARVRAFFVPNDPMLKDQWHMERIGATRAWDFATGRGVTVAVVDTGIACETFGGFMKGTDLASTECVTGWNVVTGNEHANDDQGHGTHVAGTIAQSTDNALGGAGVAFHARLMPVKVLNADGFGTTADVADGIRWAAEHGANVINLSLGGPRNSKVLQKAIDYARSRNVVVVAAAGNTGGSVQYPGANDGVIGVSATDPDDKIAKFSSRGEGVDIGAPGVNVTQQTICNKGRNKCETFPAWNGTSMASPHVAGAAALVMSLGVTEPSAVEAALRSTARVVDDSEAGKKQYGAGILQAASAVERITLKHALVRFLALFGLTFLVASGARKKNQNAASPWTPLYWIPALVAGPGLFFFAPWILPRVHLAVDLLARPLGDLDLVLGLDLHRFLPLANAVIPFALTALTFGMKKARPAVAGLAVGTAAYLISVAALGEATGPFGQAALIGWAAVNAVVCLWLARTNLAETN